MQALVIRSAPRASDTDILVPQRPPNVSYVSGRTRKRTKPPMALLPTHTPPLWILVLRSAPRASGTGLLVSQKPPDVGYISSDAYATITTLRARVRMWTFCEWTASLGCGRRVRLR